MSNIGTKKQTKEEQKTEADKDDSHKGMSDLLQLNRNSHNKSKA